MDICQENAVCGSCTNVCIKDSLACSMCRIWFHKRCVKLTPQKYECIISTDKDLLWLCEVCRKRPWHFCICSKSGELNISLEEVNEHDHDCTHGDYYRPLNEEQKVTIQEESKVQEILHNEIVNVSLNPETVNCRPTVEIESDNEAEYVEYKVNAILSDVETVAGESTVPVDYFLSTQKYSEIMKHNIINNEDPEKKKSNKCEMCGKYFKSLKHFKLHISRHDIEQSVGCNQCSQSFLTFAAMRKHFNFMHLKKTQHVCTVCNNTFPSASGLRKHSKVHIPKDQREIYQCNVCELQFSDPYCFKRHMKSNCITTGKESTEIYECDQCDKKFNRKGNFTSHKDTHSRILKYPCKECEQLFKSAKAVSNHVQKCHKQRPICHYCGKVLCGTSQLKVHIATVHMEERSYLCDICGKAFKTPHYVRIHKRIHTGEKPYVCEMCGKGFINKNRMTCHMKKHGPKTQECDECHKTFKLKSTLKAHKLLHSGEKPHKCENCGKDFMWFTSYKLHRNNNKICGLRKRTS